MNSLKFDAAVEAFIRRDRLIVAGLILLVVILAWAYVISGAGMDMTSAAVWTPGYGVLMFFMWWIMMVAMMLPSAAPMVLTFALINRKYRETNQPYVATSLFALSYLVAWAVFSLFAVFFQWLFEQTGNLSPMLVGTSQVFGAALLIAAGVYQFTPIKQSCLRHCRSPQSFISIHWRSGASGAVRMGMVHGAYCVGCCWFLMGLLFFGGVMNLYWIAGIALYILIEKIVPGGHVVGYATGIGLSAWGVAILLGFQGW